MLILRLTTANVFVYPLPVPINSYLSIYVLKKQNLDYAA